MCCLLAASQIAFSFPNAPFKICGANGGCLAPNASNTVDFTWQPPSSTSKEMLWFRTPAGSSGGSSYSFLINSQTGKCLDVVNGSLSNSVHYTTATCCAACTSMWWRQPNNGHFAGTTNIRNLPSGKCITMGYAPNTLNTWDGYPPQQWTCGNVNQFNQFWSYPEYPGM